jgi:excisionase family DNA binding protein
VKAAALVLAEAELQQQAANDDAEPPPAADMVQWIDAFALALAAGVRVGERGMHRGADLASTAKRDPEVMDVEDVATFLGVDRKTVYDYAGRGEIPCRRLGKRILFSRSALVSWLGSCKVVSRVNGD